MMEIRRISKDHIVEVADIERLCFSEPWSRNSLELLVRDGGVGFVAVMNGKVAAYGGMLTVLDEGQITNIATHPEQRRRGYAREVLQALIGYARENGIRAIFLEVRASNNAAISLYTSMGFECIGERKAFYRAPVEDAILMCYNA